MLEQRIQQHFIDSADLKYQAAQVLSQPIAAAVQAVLACVTSGGKLLACGSGPSAAQARQFAALCVAGFERERPELAALALSADAALHASPSGQIDAEQGLARQVRALGQAGDVLLALSVAGNDPALLAAAVAAHERDMQVIAFTGRDGGKIAAMLKDNDILLNVPHPRTARIQEVHILLIHALCDCIDTMLIEGV